MLPLASLRTSDAAINSFFVGASGRVGKDRPYPDTRMCLVWQKLQMLNCCRPEGEEGRETTALAGSRNGSAEKDPERLHHDQEEQQQQQQWSRGEGEGERRDQHEEEGEGVEDEDEEEDAMFFDTQEYYQPSEDSTEAIDLNEPTDINSSTHSSAAAGNGSDDGETGVASGSGSGLGFRLLGGGDDDEALIEMRPQADTVVLVMNTSTVPEVSTTFLGVATAISALEEDRGHDDAEGVSSTGVGDDEGGIDGAGSSVSGGGGDGGVGDNSGDDIDDRGDSINAGGDGVDRGGDGTDGGGNDFDVSGNVDDGEDKYGIRQAAGKETSQITIPLAEPETAMAEVQRNDFEERNQPASSSSNSSSPSDSNSSSIGGNAIEIKEGSVAVRLSAGDTTVLGNDVNDEEVTSSALNAPAGTETGSVKQQNTPASASASAPAAAPAATTKETTRQQESDTSSPLGKEEEEEDEDTAQGGDDDDTCDDAPSPAEKSETPPLETVSAGSPISSEKIVPATMTASKTMTGELRLLCTGAAVRPVRLQSSGPMTGDMLEQQTLGQAAAYRGREVVLSDMRAFRGENVGAVFADFVRWYRPECWQQVKHSADFRFLKHARILLVLQGVRMLLRENIIL